jgi:hypothetical protein
MSIGFFSMREMREMRPGVRDKLFSRTKKRLYIKAGVFWQRNRDCLSTCVWRQSLIKTAV